jgi:hypothetical protein
MFRRQPGAALVAAIFAPLAAFAQETAATADTAPSPSPAAAPAAEVADGGTGTVIFFREKKFAGSAIRYKVRENGVELCKLQSGTYCKIDVPAGKHEYVVHSEAKDVLTLEVEPGQTYYVIGGLTVGVFAGHPNLSPSDKATYEAMLPKLKDFTGQDLDPPGSDDKK